MLLESKLTIFFDEPFWVGVFEELDGDKLSACKVVFGAEPTDDKADNPKRRQRNAQKQLEKSGVGTKSQQALQKQYEENKLERKQRSREQKEAEKRRLFELKQQKRKEKHRGH